MNSIPMAAMIKPMMRVTTLIPVLPSLEAIKGAKRNEIHTVPATEILRRAGEAAVAAARPLRDNEYKVQLVKGLFGKMRDSLNSRHP